MIFLIICRKNSDISFNELKSIKFQEVTKKYQFSKGLFLTYFIQNNFFLIIIRTTNFVFILIIIVQ